MLPALLTSGRARRLPLVPLLFAVAISGSFSFAGSALADAPKPAAPAPTAPPTTSPKLVATKTTLSNGLEVILDEDHRTPIVTVNIWYHVGSKDEADRRNGFAHLFEHVMFQGSKHVPEDTYFRFLEKVGASSTNGTTNTDRTNYFETVPANQLELALWLESDRMGFLLDHADQKTFDSQREVVKNERRQNYENAPYGLVRQFLHEELFPKDHPYHRLTIGSPALIEHLPFWSEDDLPAGVTEDFGLKHFSVQRDLDLHIIDTIKLIQRYNPHATFFASAWSAPAWMKTNNRCVRPHAAPVGERIEAESYTGQHGWPADGSNFVATPPRDAPDGAGRPGPAPAVLHRDVDRQEPAERHRAPSDR